MKFIHFLLVSDFCDKHSLESKKSAPPAAPTRAAIQDDEAMLKAAIAASLEPKTTTAFEEPDDIIDLTDIVPEVLPEEPSADEVDVTRVQIRTPDGQRLVRRIRKTDPINILFIFVRHTVRKNQNIIRKMQQCNIMSCRFRMLKQNLFSF